MADGVAITAGSGTTILTDDTGAGGHAQVVKLAISTDGSGTLIPADATNGIDVDVTRLRPDGTNTLPAMDAAARRGYVQLTDGTNSQTVASNGGAAVAGCTAHDATDAGSPVKIGAKAETSPAGATLVADGDRTDLYADADGLLITKPYTAFGDILVERVSNTDGNSTASTVFGATASARNCITTIAVYNDSTTNGFVDIRDGTAGTVLFTIPAPAKGGAITNFPLPLRQTTANTALAYDVSAALTTVYISFIGFKSKA